MDLRKKVFRSVGNTSIAGVCSAIAHFLEVSPKIVRIAYIAFTVLTALFPGIFLYFFLMLLIPKETEDIIEVKAEEL